MQGHGLAKSSPTFAAALALGFGGTAVGGVAGGIVGVDLGIYERRELRRE
jgi:hypothetical protein